MLPFSPFQASEQFSAMSQKSDFSKNERIQVFARCRPMNSEEKNLGSTSIIEVVPEMNKLVLKDRKASKEYFFDQVFSPDTEQIAVYGAVVEPLVREVLTGYSCTVFAYGQTGTGKTYTMEGERTDVNCPWKDDPAAGIIPRSLHQLFEELNQAENVMTFTCKVSFYEIYNEDVYDLLSSSDFSKLRLYEDSSVKDSVKIKGLEEVVVETKDEVYTILERGTAKRHTAETRLNACSSRSHTVFTIVVEILEKTPDGRKVKNTGKLNLVDLAGSENVRRSGAIDKRAREAGNINQSLLTLGRVITALIEKQVHVPYRESKLTRILQYSLGGHAKTSIIATISPALCNLDETISTLDYAAKAKAIDINPELSRKIIHKGLIKKLTKENELLRMENEVLIKDLAAARNDKGYYVDIKNHESMVQKVSLLEKEVKALKAENSKVCQEADLTKKDMEDLHGKIRRLQTVAYYNEDVCSGLQLLYQEQCEHLSHMIADYSKERIKFSECLKKNQDYMNCVLSGNVQSGHRETPVSNLQLLLKGYSIDLNEQATSDRQCAMDLLQDLKSLKDSLASECEKFLTQSLSVLLNDLNDEKAATEVRISKLTDLCVQIQTVAFSDTYSYKRSVQKKSARLLCFKVCDMLEDLQKFQSDTYENIAAAFKSFNYEAIGKIKTKNHKLNGIIASFSNQIDTEFRYLEEKLEALLDISIRSGDVFKEAEKSYADAVSQLQLRILENGTEIEKFISEAFVTDIPTGTTPQQRAYRSPSNLRATSLSHFFDVEVENNTCFKVTEESNITDVSAVLSSQDISLVSGLCDSDGCESNNNSTCMVTEESNITDVSAVLSSQDISLVSGLCDSDGCESNNNSTCMVTEESNITDVSAVLSSQDISLVSNLCDLDGSESSNNSTVMVTEESNITDVSAVLSSQDISLVSNLCDLDGSEPSNNSTVMPETHPDNEDKENMETEKVPRRKSVRFSEPPTVSERQPLSPLNNNSNVKDNMN